MEKKTIGKFISALRRANGMTQKELGERLFVSDKTISRWECDESTPELSLIPAIAEIFGITTDELLRGEKNNPNKEAVLSEDTINKQIAKSDKQFKLMLHNRKKKYSNLSFISIGLTIIGLIVAMICNLGFSRGLLGFCLASIFFLAGVICQLCFTIGFRLLADEEEARHLESIRTLNNAMVFGTIKIFFGVLILWAFCLPIATMTRSGYYGLVIDSWLLFGSLFALVAFILGYCIYKLFVLTLLIKKEIIFLSEAENDRLKKNNNLLKKVCIIFLIAFLIIVIAIYFVENTSFVKQEIFDNPEDFKAFVERQYDEWYEHGYGTTDDTSGGSIITNPDLDKDFSYPSDSKRTGYIEDYYGNVVLTYYYNPDLYRDIYIRCYEDNRYEIVVTTVEAFANGQELYDTLITILELCHIINFVACVGFYLIRSKKRS